MNRAKLYQLVLFPMNNGATNVYYILTLNFIAYCKWCARTAFDVRDHHGHSDASV